MNSSDLKPGRGRYVHGLYKLKIIKLSCLKLSCFSQHNTERFIDKETFPWWKVLSIHWQHLSFQLKVFGSIYSWKSKTYRVKGKSVCAVHSFSHDKVSWEPNRNSPVKQAKPKGGHHPENEAIYSSKSKSLLGGGSAIPSKLTPGLSTLGILHLFCDFTSTVHLLKFFRVQMIKHTSLCITGSKCDNHIHPTCSRSSIPHASSPRPLTYIFQSYNTIYCHLSYLKLYAEFIYDTKSYVVNIVSKYIRNI